MLTLSIDLKAAEARDIRRAIVLLQNEYESRFEEVPVAATATEEPLVSVATTSKRKKTKEVPPVPSAPVVPEPPAGDFSEMMSFVQQKIESRELKLEKALDILRTEGLNELGDLAKFPNKINPFLEKVKETLA